MSITLEQSFVFQIGLRQDKSIYCGLNFNRFAGFFDSSSLMNEGDLECREHWGSNHQYDS